jgi:cell wall-associated NlpC family hydrolase
MLPPMTALDHLLQAGDIVFINVDDPLYRRVGLATGSKATHVGIAFPDDRHGWIVAESTIPLSKYTPLDRFVCRTANGWVAVRRVRGGLTTAQAQALRRACDARMGRFYHLGFNYDSRRLFCSKLVYDAYRAALGIEVGARESLEHMLKERPDTPLAFWRLWFLGSIPWTRQTVTPASQLNSEKLDRVYA